MKVYISGPMDGMKDYLENFREVEESLLKLGRVVVNPARLDKAVKGCGLSREDYLELDLKLLEWCDTIVMLDGWQRSRGCNREYGYAIGTKKKIIAYSTLKTMEKEQKTKNKKNGWIRPGERLPDQNETVLVTVKRHRWAADYDSYLGPENEKTEHEEVVYVTCGRLDCIRWKYMDFESGVWEEALYTNVLQGVLLNEPIAEVIAWQPLPDEYEEER